MPKVTPKVVTSPTVAPPPFAPYWATTDGELVRLYLGDVVGVLERMPSRSVQMCVTSPPYWGLRDYGTGEWVGGDPNCKHEGSRVASRNWEEATTAVKGTDGVYQRRLEQGAGKNSVQGRNCTKCSAVRIDAQLGSEPSPDCETKGQAQCGKCFVCAMVKVFRAVKRVLRNDGTLWLNLGDTYSGAQSASGRKLSSIQSPNKHGRGESTPKGFGGVPSLGDGNLVGIPWRVALALQADGWVLRQDIIWAKPSPMPESVRNRCTKAHEYIFLLSPGGDYYYDADAIKEKSDTADLPPRKLGTKQAATEFDGMISHNEDHASAVNRVASRNKRSVWTVEEEEVLLRWMAENCPEKLEEYLASSANKKSTWRVSAQGYDGAHFATFPPKLIEPCILAGTSEYGACSECGAPYKRVVETKALTRPRPNDYVKRTGEEGTGNSCSNSVAGIDTTTLGWEPTCVCEFYRLRDNVPSAIIEELKTLGYG